LIARKATDGFIRGSLFLVSGKEATDQHGWNTDEKKQGD
jgi:hypothetical protein